MLIFAHRGASVCAPENTMSAFRLAREMGADGIELDVQRTSDGTLVVCHDEELGRTSDGEGQLAAHTLGQLRALDFGSWFSPEFAGERIPTLAQVLDFMRPTNLLLNVEIKASPFYHDPRLAEAVATAVSASGMAERIWVSSFDHECLALFHRYCPEVPMGLLVSAALLHPAAYARSCGAQAYHPHHKLLSEQAAHECRACGIGVHPWTADRACDLLRLQRLGADWAITNSPDQARRILRGEETE